MLNKTQPLSIIYNQKSGFHANNKDGVYEALVRFLTTYGYEIQSFEMSQVASFKTLMQHVIHRHQTPNNLGIVVAAGGDGTLNAVAQSLIQHDIPMGILPLGPFNYVARALNIPLDILDAAKVIA